MNGVSDDELRLLVRDLGQNLSDLFLVGNEVFSEKGVVGWSANYEPVRLNTAVLQNQLVGLLRRLSVESYPTPEAFADHLSRGREWEALYCQLREVLSRHGVEAPLGAGDFFLVADDFGSPQHKVECTSSFLKSSVVEEVQYVLRQYKRNWTVIFAATDTPKSVRVFCDRVESAS